MENSKQYYYNKVSEAIKYLETNITEQPSLNAIAEQVHISPFHFQKISLEMA